MHYTSKPTRRELRLWNTFQGESVAMETQKKGRKIIPIGDIVLPDLAPFISAEELAEQFDKFYIVSAKRRVNPTYKNEEILFEVVVKDGDANKRYAITLSATMHREAILTTLEKNPGAIIGPMTMVKAQGKFWQFVDPSKVSEAVTLPEIGDDDIPF